MVIVAMPEVELMTALVGDKRDKVNVSSNSSTESAKIGTLTVFTESPGLKVKVPLTVA